MSASVKTIVFLPNMGDGVKVGKSDFGWKKETLDNPHTDTELDGHFKLKIDLNSAFMQQTNEKFALGVFTPNGIDIEKVENKIMFHTFQK